MLRRFSFQRLELHSGIFAAAFSLLALAEATLLPVFFVCDVSTSCAPGSIHDMSLVVAHPNVWPLLLGLQAFTLAGAAGAVADARGSVTAGGRPTTGVGLLALWGATLAVFAIFALGSPMPSLAALYVPSTTQLALGACAALVRRLATRPAIIGAADTPPEAT